MYVIALEASFCMVHVYCQIVEDSFSKCISNVIHGNRVVIINSSIFIVLFSFFGQINICHGKVDAVRIGITQIMKLTLAITIRMSHTLSIPRILTQPFVVSFGISNKICIQILIRNVCPKTTHWNSFPLLMILSD
jgi:hypothetical protein